MSEVKLNLTDTQRTISGTIHGSVADACIAALSAEPETLTELETALARYNKPTADISAFGWFHEHQGIDKAPWDAGIVIIDLAGRIVASESTYSKPGPEGEVSYHDGVCGTDTSVFYRLPDDWLFLDAIDQYECLRAQRRLERLSVPPLDARAILYGRPLLEFIVSGVAQNLVCNSTPTSAGPLENDSSDSADQDDALRQQISLLHARWLMTARDDLRGQSPKDVLLARQDFIDYDLHTRSMQWSMQGEGPPCLSTDSFAYRFAGFGTHEWVIYYDLVRHLLWTASTEERARIGDEETGGNQSVGLETQIARLEQLKTDWLERPQDDYDNRIPALLIENERIRLPIAMRGRDMVIDDDCPVCQMMANEAEFGMEVGFWHLDGSHMDDDFAFSNLRTREEWEARRREWEEFAENFNREWEERQQRERLTVAEPVEERCDISGMNRTSDGEELIDSAKPAS